MRQVLLFFVCIGGAGMLALGATTTNSMVPSILGLILFYGYIYYVINRFLKKRKNKQLLKEQQRLDIETRQKFNDTIERLTSIVEKYENRDGIK